jgi:hypothetical protein
MSTPLREILRQKVLDSRQKIKASVMDTVTESLEIQMNNAAGEGETSGSIYVNNECHGNHLDNVERILELEKFGKKKSIYDWIFEEIQKNENFKGIYFKRDTEYDGDKIIQEDKIDFYWYIDEN